MRSALFGLGIAIVSVAAAIAAGSAAWVFWDAWKASDLESFRALVGAFAGAFFAYLFVRFGDGLKKIYDRREKNHTSLVRLQHYFNDCLNTASDNIFIADECISVFDEKRLQGNEHPIFMNVFHTFPVDRELVIGLTNLKFVNEVYSLNVGLKKMNDSMATVDRAYGQVRDAFVAKHISSADYILNARRTRQRSIRLRAYLVQMKKDLIRLFATTNLLLKDPPFLVRVVRLTAETRYPKDFDTVVGQEIVRIAAEMEGIARESAMRIQEAEHAAQQSSAADAVQVLRR
jgi:hypothetical protein